MAPFSRRDFLVGSATAVALAACSSSGSKATTSTTRGASTTTRAAARAVPRRTRKPGERWDPSKPEGTDLLPQIEHVVVLMQENHSFDNYLGTLGRGDGFTLDAQGRPTNSNPDAAGKAVRAFRLDDTCQTWSVSQNWNASHTQWNQGAMDGFVRSDSGRNAMGYWDAQTLPFYASLAQTFPLCDRWFASCLAQTYPNRRFMLSGTAGGLISTSLDTLQDPMPANGTIMQALDRHDIEWRDYYTSLPTAGLWLPYALAHQDRLQSIDRFFTDARNGDLPAFCLVEPDWEKASEENPQDISRGEAFTARVVDAVMQSPNWAKTVLIWCYDEHGGYYDHVAPPAAPKPDDIAPKLGPDDIPGAYDRLGFRVPAAIISPFAKREHVSSVVRDHTAVMGLLEHKFNLPALTHRDGWSDDLLDCLDLDGTPAFATPPKLAKPLNHEPLDAKGTAGTICRS